MKCLLALDVAAVIAFVAIGRDTHDEGVALIDLATTATPFLMAVAVGWLITRAWRSPTAVPTGIGIVTATVLLGMTLRSLVFGAGTAWSFILVATAFLGLTMLGWRAVILVVQRHRKTVGDSG